MPRMFGQIHFLILKNIYNNTYLENKDYGSDRIKNEFSHVYLKKLI